MKRYLVLYTRWMRLQALFFTLAQETVGGKLIPPACTANTTYRSSRRRRSWPVLLTCTTNLYCQHYIQEQQAELLLACTADLYRFSCRLQSRLLCSSVSWSTTTSMLQGEGSTGGQYILG